MPGSYSLKATKVISNAIETSYVKSSDLTKISVGQKTPNGFTLTQHAADTINDSTRFSGKLGLDQIDDIVAHPELKVLDTTTGNINFFKMTDFSKSSYTRITIPSDGGQRIISTGFDGIKSVTNKVYSGRYNVIKGSVANNFNANLKA